MTESHPAKPLGVLHVSIKPEIRTKGELWSSWIRWRNAPRHSRLRVQKGPHGVPADHIGQRLGLPSAPLAFHLKELKMAGLATCTRNRRSLVYAAEYPTMNARLFYLTENCCDRPSSEMFADLPAGCGH
jgi:hypothetical protein